MKKRGEPVRVNDVIAYVITGDGQDYNKNAAERAYSPQDVSKPGSGLTIGILLHGAVLMSDYNYYLAKQILPPIERLCAPIDCTDSARIAECLGLDPRLFRSSGPISPSERTIEPLESQISDEERFRDTDPFVIKCISCSEEHPFSGISSSKVEVVMKPSNLRTVLMQWGWSARMHLAKPQSQRLLSLLKWNGRSVSI